MGHRALVRKEGERGKGKGKNSSSFTLYPLPFSPCLITHYRLPITHYLINPKSKMV
ncbi:hypothetical protein [Tolypothrix sp. VBCCA 56010]|uniref:hypothetical protein n=1 Tax=Tolypothrix sp. VBCCA 56010 TaxID=3137731 RepID=UPI003D7E551A